MKKKTKNTIPILVLGKNDNPKTSKLSRFLNKIFSHLNVIIFAYVKEKDILYPEASIQINNLKATHYKIREKFKLPLKKDKIFIQPNSIKEIFISTGKHN